MEELRTVKVTRRGGLTLPVELREKYDIEPGDVLTLMDLNGAVVLTSGTMEVDHLASSVRDRLEATGESLESVLDELADRRKDNGHSNGS